MYNYEPHQRYKSGGKYMINLQHQGGGGKSAIQAGGKSANSASNWHQSYRGYTGGTTCMMEFPPSEWFLFPATAFETAPVRSPGEYTMELLAQIRPNGRIMDHWRIAIGGSNILEVSVDLGVVIPAASAAKLPKWRLLLQQWPADLPIRRNMVTSAWTDVLTMISSNSLVILDEEGNDVEAGLVVESLGKIRDKSLNSASWRWAVCASEAAKMELQLQCLPVSANYLASKPVFKRYKIKYELPVS